MRLVLVIFSIIICLGLEIDEYLTDFISDATQIRANQAVMLIPADPNPHIQFIPGVIIKTDGTEISNIIF